MNKRQKKKKRKKFDVALREMMRMTLEQMSPDDWKPPLMQSIYCDSLIKISKLGNADATKTQD